MEKNDQIYQDAIALKKLQRKKHLDHVGKLKYTADQLALEYAKIDTITLEE